MIIDANMLDAQQAYKLLIATVVPRAIGWFSHTPANRCDASGRD
jgi:hypothetical protein